jgi:glyoxylase-like metal-dependent hydrolase (beta-lactamase superfamily II)
VIFAETTVGGCRSELLGCADTRVAALVDPEESAVDGCLASASREGVRVRFIIDSHTPADHFSHAPQLARRLEATKVRIERRRSRRRD